MTSVQQPRHRSRDVAEALRAEDTGLTLECDGSPVSTFQIRAELVDRLRSHGGRPALGHDAAHQNSGHRQSVARLEKLAASFSDLGFVPSAGQVASVLLGLSLPLASKEPHRVKKVLGALAPTTSESDR